MTLLALVVAVLLIHDPRRAGQLGGWVEGIRRRTLLTSPAGAAVTGGVTAGPVDAADDDAQLTAYNIYLNALGRTEDG
jgi:hypothetical protein